MAKRYKSTKVDPSIQMTQQDLAAIAGARAKIAVHIDQLRANGKSSFVRISSRRCVRGNILLSLFDMTITISLI